MKGYNYLILRGVMSMERNNLSSILSDGMVLQRGDKTKIFGTTVENSKIEI